MQQDFVLPCPLSVPVPGALAQRPPTLAGAPVALIDNTRMEQSTFQGLAEALAQQVRAQGATVVPVRLPLLSWSAEELASQAQALGGRGLAAAVIGLGEAGICQPTVDLAIALERLGVPTVTVLVEPGVSLARAVAAAHLPGLPLVDLGVPPHEMKGRAEAVVRAVGAQILAALLRAPGAEPAPLVRDDATAPATPRLFPAVDAVLRDWRRAVAGDDPGAAALNFLRACEAHGLGDGLPAIPPTPALVRAMCEASPWPPDSVVIPPTPPSGAPVTVRLAAANAVMAGCEPRHFACVLAALSAMAAPHYRLRQAAITTHPGTNVIFVSGPLAAQSGVAAGAGCFGPGQRANLSIGRAVNLCMMNVLRSVPGLTDLATHGSAAELGTCFADMAFGSWPAWHEAVGGAASTVLVHRCAPLCGIMDQLSKTPEGILRGIAATSASIGSNNAYCPAELLVVLSPDHAAVIQQHGWSRADVQRFLYETARNPRALLAGRGFDPSWPASFAGLDPVPVVPRPQDIVVAVAGGHGPQSLVGLPWGLSRAALVTVDARGEIRLGSRE